MDLTEELVATVATGIPNTISNIPYTIENTSLSLFELREDVHNDNLSAFYYFL
jgi:hypothetical protein